MPGEVVDAREEARRIVAAAHEEAGEVRAAAAREGAEAGRAEVTELLARARQAALEAGEQSRNDLRVLAVRIAEKILGRELTLSPEAVIDVVATALGEARSRRHLRVRVHPGDRPSLLEGRPRLEEVLIEGAILTLVDDDTIPRGGCIIETEVGTIDARLGSQLAAIERALVKA